MEIQVKVILGTGFTCHRTVSVFNNDKCKIILIILKQSWFNISAEQEF